MIAPIYLDGFASTPLAPEARSAMVAAYELPGNAGSPNVSGERAAEIIAIGRAQIAEMVGATPAEIVFTSGATEANNMAILGVTEAIRRATPQRNRLLISAVEHKAIMEPAQVLAARGFTVDLAPVTSTGLLDLEKFASMIDDDLALVSIMLANNETGVVQPVKAVAELVHAAGGLIHTDAAQAIGKIAVDVFDLDVDYLSMSGHKCYGPMGIGALFVAASAPRPIPLHFGGGQQASLRPGTEPVALIAGFGAAAASAQCHQSSHHLDRLIEAFLDELAVRQVRFGKITGDDTVIVGSAALDLIDVDATLLCASVARHVSLSTGSACTSGQLRSSHVLEAMGFSEQRARSVVRILANPYLHIDDMRRAAGYIATAADRSRLAAGDLRQ